LTTGVTPSERARIEALAIELDMNLPLNWSSVKTLAPAAPTPPATPPAAKPLAAKVLDRRAEELLELDNRAEFARLLHTAAGELGVDDTKMALATWTTTWPGKPNTARSR
jgi:hypothetical protein